MPLATHTRTRLRRARTTLVRLLACAAALAVAWATASQPSTAATASSTVGVHIPGSTSITNQCTSQLATDFGSVLADSRNLTTTGANVCRFQFGSSNDTATARLAQRDHTGTAMASLDAGTWQALPSTTAIQYNGVDVVDSNTAFAARLNSTMERSLDGGATWQSETQSAAAFMLAISAIDADNAYAVGGCLNACPGIARRTTAGGSTWITQTVPPGVSGGLTDVAHIPATPDTAVAVSFTGEIIRTTDGGTTWNIVHDIATGLTSIEIVDSSLMYAGGYGGVLLRSTDAGATWNPVDAGIGVTNVTDLDIVTGALWVSSEGGDLLRSQDPAAATPSFTVIWANAACKPTDVSVPDANTVLVALQGYCNGSGWLYSADASLATPSFTQVASPTLLIPFDTDASAANYAMAVGAGGAILEFDGTTFSTTHLESDVSTAIDAWDVQDVIAVGGNGYTWSSHDGGSSWTTVTTGSAKHLYGIDLVSPTEAWASASAGTLFHTTDGGATWTEHPTGVTSTRLNDVVRLGTGTLLAVSRSSEILRSIDDGATWSISTTLPQLYAYDLEADPSTGRVWVSAVDGHVYASTDDGRTFVERIGPFTGAGNASNVAATGSDHAYVALGSMLYRTTDGGASWTSQVTPNGTESVTAIDAVDDRTLVLATGANGSLLRTSDGGATWSTFDQFATHAFPVMVDAATTYVTSYNGSVMKQSPAVTIPDYAGGAWAGAPSAFGVCLQAIGANTAATWTVDAGGTPGLCEASDADNWYAVPTAPTAVASTTSVGATGSIDLVWGLRAGAAQEPKQYVATVDVEVVAATP